MSTSSNTYEFVLSTAEKQKECADDKHHYLLHSWGNKETEVLVLTDFHNTTAFAFSPPAQTVSKSSFVETVQATHRLKIKPLVEGTMVHFFWHAAKNEWTLATRHGVGGEYSYIQPLLSCEETPHRLESEFPIVTPTFRQMVVSALAHSMEQMLSLQNPLENDDCHPGHVLDLLPKHLCYTCILQHHDNHLVYSVSPHDPRLVLDAIYQLDLQADTGRVTVTALEQDNPVWQIARDAFQSTAAAAPTPLVMTADELFIDGTNVPLLREALAFDEATDTVPLAKSVRMYPPAWAIFNETTGEKTEVKNPHYSALHRFRNIQPNLRFQFLDILRKQQIEQYLSFFPQHEEFAVLHQEWWAFIGHIHDTYVQYYVRHSKKQLPKKYFVLAAKLHHNVYLPNKQIITRKVVEKYLLETMTTGGLFYVLTQKKDD